MANERRMRECISQLVADIIAVDPHSIHLQQFEKQTDIEVLFGQYRRPLYRIVDHAGNIQLVVKVYVAYGENVSGFNKMLKAHQIFKSLRLKKSCCVDIIKYRHFTLDDQSCDAVVMSPAEGKGIGESIQDIGTCAEKERESKMDVLLKTVRTMGEALAELHSVHFRTQGQVGQSYTQEANKTMQKFLHFLTKIPQLFPFDKKSVIEHLSHLKSQLEDRPLVIGVTHGDPDPTNMVYHSGNHMITMLDIDDIVDSVIGDFEPVGPIARDYVEARLSMRRAMIFRRFITDHMIQVETSFHQTYQKYLGKLFPSDAAIKYFSAIYWMKKILLVTALERHLSPNMKKDAQVRMISFKYRELAITSLQEQFMVER